MEEWVNEAIESLARGFLQNIKPSDYFRKKEGNNNNNEKAGSQFVQINNFNTESQGWGKKES